MEIKDIEYIEQYFDCYSTSDYLDMYQRFPVRGNYSNREFEFMIVISKEGEVWQTNSDHDITGVELVTLEDFKVRFKSFNGEELEWVEEFMY